MPYFYVMKTTHLLISGKVQGVFYRASAKKIADQFELKGWIRNRPDGNVEALVQGNDDAVNRFIAWCKKGPDGALVSSVQVAAKDNTTLLTTASFEIVS